MTNLNGSESSWKNYLTRERVLVGTPLLVGALIGAGLFALAGLPHWLESGERTRRISELKVQEQSLPLIAARVQQQQQKLVVIILTKPEHQIHMILKKLECLN